MYNNKKKLKFEETINKIEIGELQYYNFYDVEVEPTQFFSIRHYLKHSEYDNIDYNHPINILFFDIECYFYKDKFEGLKSAEKHPINLITTYYTKDKTYRTFLLIMDDEIKDKKNLKFLNERKLEFKNKIIRELKKDKYILEGENLEIFEYTDELKMITDCFKNIHNLDPHLLSGFYSDRFDIPYIYLRLLKLTKNNYIKVNNILSKFGVVKKVKIGKNLFRYDIADYPLADIRKLFMPRDEGGLNYGKKLQSYGLSYISDYVLGMKKIDHNDEGNLNQLYVNDIFKIVKYNIADVALLNLLNIKLEHIFIHNLLRRNMNTPFTMSMIGSSALFSTFFSYELYKQNKHIKYGIINEFTFSLDKNDINILYKPNFRKIKWTVNKVSKTDYNKIVNKFSGAYVKDGYNKIIIGRKHQLDVDLDK